MTPEELRVLQHHCLYGKGDQTGIEWFTRYMFKEFYGRKFHVGVHHKKIWEVLDRVIKGQCKRLIINMPPRYGKTEICVKMFIAYGLAINPKSRFLHLSYADNLAVGNSEYARDYVKHEAYQALFPNTVVRPNSDSKKDWETTLYGGVYATAAGGPVTGFGAGVDDDVEGETDSDIIDSIGKIPTFSGAIVIDDPLKSDDADSDVERSRVNDRWDSTIESRANGRNTPVIVDMQRLHEMDFTGYLLSREDGDQWEVLSLPAIYEEDGEEKALYPRRHTLEELKLKQKSSPFIFERQYMQSPQPLEGRLYQPFATYSVLPITKSKVSKIYVDVADKGHDYLCAIHYIETEIGCYVMDLLYTKSGSANTEPMLVNMIRRIDPRYGKTICAIESNATGEVFGRNIKNQLRIEGDYTTEVKLFHTQQNKAGRILHNKDAVNNMVIMPENWESRLSPYQGTSWNTFYNHVTSFRAEGRNAYDDAPDALTGIVEQINKTRNSILAIGN